MLPCLRTALTVFVLALGMLVFPSCKKNDKSGLIIVSPHPPEIREEFGNGFEQWYARTTGKSVSVTWLDVGGTGEAIEYVKSRNTGPNPSGGVDIFFGGGVVPFLKLQGLGLLAPCSVPDSILARIPMSLNNVQIRDTSGLWFGAALSGFGIIYNKKIIKNNHMPLPNSWADLARPEFTGWVASGDPRYSGTIHMMYEIILQAFGWEKGWDILLRMGANIQTFTKGASQAAKDVSMGQAALGLSVDFYAYAEIDRYGAGRLGFILPGKETVVTPDGIGVLKNCANPAYANAFVTYVLSEGQKLWLYKKGVDGGPVNAALCRLPVDSALYNIHKEKHAVMINPLTMPAALVYDGALTGKRWDILGDLIAARIIYPHAALKKAVCFTMDISEEEILDLATTWNKPEHAEKKIRQMNQWTTEAQRSYDLPCTVKGEQ